MTDETKKLFDAPWHTAEEPGDYAVSSDNGEAIVEYSAYDEKTNNRLARLPELYDALMEAAYEHCRMCLYRHVERASEMPSPDDMAKNGCQISDYPHCPNKTWWKLLRKVRDGE